MPIGLIIRNGVLGQTRASEEFDLPGNVAISGYTQQSGSLKMWPAYASDVTPIINSPNLEFHYSYKAGPGAAVAPGYFIRCVPTAQTSGTGELSFFADGLTERVRFTNSGGIRTDAGYDALNSGTTLAFGTANATSINIGRSNYTTTINGYLNVGTGYIDTPSAANSLYIGGTNAGAVYLSRTGQLTQVLGSLIVNGNASITGTSTLYNTVTAVPATGATSGTQTISSPALVFTYNYWSGALNTNSTGYSLQVVPSSAANNVGDLIFYSQGSVEKVRFTSGGNVIISGGGYIDAPSAASSLNIGTNTGTNINIGKTGSSTTVNGSLTVQQNLIVNGAETIVGGTTFGQQINLGPFAPATSGQTYQNSIELQFQYAYWNGTASVTTDGMSIRAKPYNNTTGVGDMSFIGAEGTERFRISAMSNRINVDYIDSLTVGALQLGNVAATSVYVAIPMSTNGALSVNKGAVVLPSSNAAIPLTVRGAASQSVNLFEVQDSGITSKFAIGNTGKMWAYASASISPGSSTAQALTIVGASGQSVDILKVTDNATNDLIRVTSTGGFVSTVSAAFSTTTASKTPLSVKGANLQSVDIFQVLSYDGASYLTVSAAGTISSTGNLNLANGNVTADATYQRFGIGQDVISSPLDEKIVFKGSQGGRDTGLIRVQNLASNGDSSISFYDGFGTKKFMLGVYGGYSSGYDYAPFLKYKDSFTVLEMGTDKVAYKLDFYGNAIFGQKVGVGATPTYPLDVQTGYASDVCVRVRNTNLNGLSAIHFADADYPDNGLTIGTGNQTSAYSWNQFLKYSGGVFRIYNGNNSLMEFADDNNIILPDNGNSMEVQGGFYANRFAADSSTIYVPGNGAGQVGIGTTGPFDTERMLIQGDLKINGSIIIGNGGALSASQFQATINGGGSGFAVYSYTNGDARAQFVGNWPSAYYWGIGYNTSSNTVQIGIVSSINAGTWNGVQNCNLMVGGAVQAPTHDTATAIALNLGTVNATSVSIGKTTTTTTIQGSLSHGGFTADTAGVTAYYALKISANDKVAAAQANALANSWIVGFANTTATSGSAVSPISCGTITPVKQTGETAWTAGVPIYLSATEAGRVTATAPTTAGAVVLRLGFAKNATDLFIRIGEPLVNS